MKTTMSMLATVFASLCAGFAGAAPVIYNDEAAFLDALEIAPHALIRESFEDADAWAGVRTGGASNTPRPSTLTHRGITWVANNAAGRISSSNGFARSGAWNAFHDSHGSYAAPDAGRDCTLPGECTDGIRVSANDMPLYAVGGWFRTNTPTASLGVFPESYPLGAPCASDSTDCEDVPLSSTWTFLGIHDPDGMRQVEFRELDGMLDRDGFASRNFVFGDDFTIAVAPAAVPVPPALPLLSVALMALLCKWRRRSAA